MNGLPRWWPASLRFLTDLEVPFTNNEASAICG